MWEPGSIVQPGTDGIALKPEAVFPRSGRKVWYEVQSSEALGDVWVAWSSCGGGLGTGS
jgi:hypothetical protein